MTPGPAVAVDWIMTELPRTQSPIDPEVLLVQIGTRLNWFSSSEDAQEKAERWRTPFLTRLRFVINDPERRGRPTRFEFNSSTDYLIQGACYVEEGHSSELRDSKRRRQHMDTYLAFIRSLTGRQFEGVCRGVLDLLGCEDPILTPRGGDQGIDFHGRIEMRGRLNMQYVQEAVDEAMHSWVVGQAKQIEGNVSTSEIRDLVGAVEIARLGISADEGQALRELGMRPYDSVWRFFVTTGKFSRDSSKLIYRLGLLGFDGEAVASILADHQVADVDGACDRGAFDTWVASHLPD
jgi:hypothetical protein